MLIVTTAYNMWNESLKHHQKLPNTSNIYLHKRVQDLEKKLKKESNHRKLVEGIDSLKTMLRQKMISDNYLVTKSSSTLVYKQMQLQKKKKRLQKEQECMNLFYQKSYERIQQEDVFLEEKIREIMYLEKKQDSLISASMNTLNIEKKKRKYNSVRNGDSNIKSKELFHSYFNKE